MAARRLHGLIYATIALCCMAIIICSVALGTDQWFSSNGNGLGSDDLKITVKYGLFQGTKTRESGALDPKTSDLKVVCLESKCMYSCGTSGALRKKNLEQIMKGPTVDDDSVICGGGGSAARNFGLDTFGNFSGRQSEASPPAPVYLNFILYLVTIACLGLAIIFSLIGGGLALYNTYRTPIQPILSVFGLYIWNGISATFVSLAMIIWGVAFATALNKNAGVSDTLIGNFVTDGNGSLGVSYWILILAIQFPLVNIGIIRYRSWKIIQMEASNVKVMTEKLESGDILLF